MANVDGAFGLRPVSRLDGAPFNAGMRRCVFASGDTVAAFINDAVKLTGTSVDGYPVVAQAAATNPIFGVVMGFEKATPDTLNVQYRAASTQQFCQVLVDPQVVYEIQCDDVTATVAATSVGLNADIVVGTGDTATGMSAIELDSDTQTTDTALQVKIIGFPDREDNEIGSTNQNVLVQINQSVTGNDAGNAGV